MPWNGAGSFVRTDGVRTGADVHAQQLAATIAVRADLTDTENEDIATGLENCVTRDGQNSPSASLPMNSQKHTGVSSTSGSASRTEYTAAAVVQDGSILDAGDTGGTATAFTATLSPAITAYANKQLFRVKFDNAFGATPTINFNAVGAKKMYAHLGGAAVQLTTNNVPDNFVALLRYDASLDSAAGGFLLLNPPFETINGLTEDTAPIAADDFLVTYDASAGVAKKVQLDNVPRFFIGTFTRDIAGATGNVAYTGVGFKPRLLIFLNANGGAQGSIGWADGTADHTFQDRQNITADSWQIGTTTSIICISSSGNTQSAALASFDSDGFTLSWTKTGSPTGTAVVSYLAIG